MPEKSTYAWEGLVVEMLKKRDTLLACTLNVLEKRKAAINEMLAQKWAPTSGPIDLVGNMRDGTIKTLHEELEEINAHLESLKEKVEE